MWNGSQAGGSKFRLSSLLSHQLFPRYAQKMRDIEDILLTSYFKSKISPPFMLLISFCKNRSPNKYQIKLKQFHFSWDSKGFLSKRLLLFMIRVFVWRHSTPLIPTFNPCAHPLNPLRYIASDPVCNNTQTVKIRLMF